MIDYKNLSQTIEFAALVDDYDVVVDVVRCPMEDGEITELVLSAIERHCNHPYNNMDIVIGGQARNRCLREGHSVIIKTRYMTARHLNKAAQYYDKRFTLSIAQIKISKQWPT